MTHPWEHGVLTYMFVHKNKQTKMWVNMYTSPMDAMGYSKITIIPELECKGMLFFFQKDPLKFGYALKKLALNNKFQKANLQKAKHLGVS